MPIAILIKMRELLDDERGQDLVEYALLTGFMAVAAGLAAADFRQHQYHFQQDGQSCRQRRAAVTPLKKLVAAPTVPPSDL